MSGITGSCSFPGGTVIKNLPANAGHLRDVGSIPRLERFPWRRARQPTLILSPGESHGQRSLTACSPSGHTELEMTAAT